MFTFHKTDTGARVPWEYLPAQEGAYQAGQLLNAEAGVLTPIEAACTTTPGYMCVANITITQGENLPVTRIKHDVVYETQLSAEAVGKDIGSKLQVSAGGLQVDGAAEGTFEINYIEETAAGSVVRGRFL